MPISAFETLQNKLSARDVTVGVIGLGYVGLPLAVAAAGAGLRTIGFDVDPAKARLLDKGQSYIEAVTDAQLASVMATGNFVGTGDFGLLSGCDVIIICVPTPLNQSREPDLSFVVGTANETARHLKPGTLVILESTTFPGTTHDILVPILETSGLTCSVDLFVAFSPEREDPGNPAYRTKNIPKIVAGEGQQATELASAFYALFLESVVPVSSTATAEAIKITENVFRAVNIALVNELKLLFDAMSIDIWEVIDGAATKPFGFMPFYPGPGLGGHCIPIDPFYLSWKARQLGLSARFVELAGEINVEMPQHIVSRAIEAMDCFHKKGIEGARVLVVGVAYKKNVPDMRESPALKIMELLEAVGADVEFLDPLAATLPKMRAYPGFEGKTSVDPGNVKPGSFSLALITTDHDAIDYAALVDSGIPIVDTRNAIARRGLPLDRVLKA